MHISRRSWLKGAAGTASAVVVAPIVNRGSFRLFAQSTERYSTRAVDLVHRSMVIDMLNPFSLYATLAELMGGHPRTWLNDPTSFTERDLQPFRDSGIRVFHIAVGTGGPNAYDETMRFVGTWNGFIAHHSDWLRRVDSPQTLAALKKSDKLGVIIGLQNSEHFRTVDDVNLFYSLGQRVSQLTYNARNLIGTGSTERTDSGLSDFGVAVVARMNQLGMAVDVSHSGDLTTLDAHRTTPACLRNPQTTLHAYCRAGQRAVPDRHLSVVNTAGE